MSTWQVPEAALTELGERVVANSAGAIASFHVAFGELVVHAAAQRIVEALTTLRESPEFEFQQLIDLAGADYPQREKRFDVVYHLLSMTKNRRIRIKVQTDEETPVPSIVGVYPAADWFEREAFDMYGIFFEATRTCAACSPTTASTATRCARTSR